jgi:hypothetical protein
MFCLDCSQNLHHFAGPYPDGWLDPIYDLFSDYHEFPTIESKAKIAAMPKFVLGDRRERTLVFGTGRLWLRKSGKASTK